MYMYVMTELPCCAVNQSTDGHMASVVIVLLALICIWNDHVNIHFVRICDNNYHFMITL